MSTEKSKADAVSTKKELHPLERRAMELLLRENMLKKGGKVVAAVSGGCDSTALLHILCALSTELELEIVCTHVNHNLRGEESDSDEKFVRDMCKKLCVPCLVYSAPVAEYALEHRLSTLPSKKFFREYFFRKRRQ